MAGEAYALAIFSPPQIWNDGHAALPR